MGDAVVGFVRHGRTCVVAGAPVCSLDRLETVGAEFLASARAANLRVCYFGAGQRLEEQYSHNASWSRVLLGAQPVWNPQRWISRVEKRSSLRAQFNRARNKGVTVLEWGAAEAENNPALRRVLAEWLNGRHLPPLHFLVEPETLARLTDRRIFVARVGDREVIGFTVLSPVPARNGWLVEQIVRGRRAPNGTAELLIDSAMRAVAASGATYATLGLSPLSERAKIPRIAQPMWLNLALRWVRVHGRRFYNFDGLDAFKSKFDPEEWEPIFAIADSVHFPPRALYAIAGAFSGGNPLLLVVKAVLRAVRLEIARATRGLSIQSKPVIRQPDRRRS
jgi:lysylphosphatidylglycerol synthetase-like protein (DUF2156 family)